MPIKDKEQRRLYERAYAREWCRRNHRKVMLGSAKKRARVRGLAFNLSLEDIVVPEVCPVLNIPIIPNTNGYPPAANSPSLDRINSKLGYTKDNIRVISWRANTLKNNATVEELELILKDLRSRPLDFL